MTEDMTHTVLQSIDKALVAQRFAHARNTYGHEARVQRQVALKMLHLLMEHAPAPAAQNPAAAPPFRHITEFGCGTGIYSRLLLHTLHPDSLLLNDLCPEMEECLKDICIPKSKGHISTPAEAPTHISFLPLDAEALDFPQGTDLITSCSTLQWFANPARFFGRCHRFLSDDGILAFSTFGMQNMREIRTLTGGGLDYLPFESLKAMLAKDFEILHAEEEIVSLPFTDPLQVLRHLKQTGVTGTEKKMWTRGRLQAFCDEYTRLFGNEVQAEAKEEAQSVSLTYHPIYVVARKKVFF